MPLGVFWVVKKWVPGEQRHYVAIMGDFCFRDELCCAVITCDKVHELCKQCVGRGWLRLETSVSITGFSRDSWNE